MIAPGLNNQKQVQLKELEIEYIDMKGEVFIRKLQENVYKNIISDFNNGKLKPETLSKILSKKNLYPEYKTNSGGKLVLKSINPSKGRINIKATFKANAKDKLLEGFSDFAQGKSFGHIEVDSSHFQDFKFTISGINLMPDSDGFKIFDYFSTN